MSAGGRCARYGKTHRSLNSAMLDRQAGTSAREPRFEPNRCSPRSSKRNTPFKNPTHGKRAFGIRYKFLGIESLAVSPSRDVEIRYGDAFELLEIIYFESVKRCYEDALVRC